MRYMVVDRRLTHLDGSHAVFSQRRQLIGCPPGTWRGLIAILLMFSLLPWIQRINPAPTSSLPPLWFGALWTAVFAGGAIQLRRWRARRRAAFLSSATLLAAEIDLGACPDEKSAIETGKVFTVRVSIPDGAVVLRDQNGSELERLPPGSTLVREQTGHSLPWSDANEGDPHDTSSIYLLVRDAPSEDLDGRFIVKGTTIGDPELEKIRTTLAGLPFD